MQNSKNKTAYFTKWDNSPEVLLKNSALTKISGIKELRKSATEYYKSVLQGTIIYKENFGEIRLSGKGLDEYMHFSADADKLLAVPQIIELILKGDVGIFQKDYKGRTDYITGFYPIYVNLKTKRGLRKAEILIAKDCYGYLFYQMFLDFDRDEAKRKALDQELKRGTQRIIKTACPSTTV